jgi:3-hydroxy-5-methyl-1-naphthoate 3-O-methyltransferase
LNIEENTLTPRLPGTDPSAIFHFRDSIYSNDLLIAAVAHFDVFSYVSQYTPSFDQLCRDLRIVPRPADVLITLLVSLGLMERQDGKLIAAGVAQEYLTRDSPWSLCSYYALLARRPQCLEFQEVLTTDRPAGWSSAQDQQDWHKSMQDETFADRFLAGMESRGVYLSSELARKISLAGRRRVLDIAGGSGVYASQFVNCTPGLTGTVLEQPPVHNATQRFLMRKGMSHRLETLSGDMFSGLPTGYDVHIYANVLHDWDLATITQLCQLSFQSLVPGGLILIFDAHLNGDKSGPLEVAQFSCLLMHSTHGRCYSSAEIISTLSEVGFEACCFIDIAAYRSVITARKPDK